MSEVETEVTAPVTTPAETEVKVDATPVAPQVPAVEAKTEDTQPEVKVAPERYELKLEENSLLGADDLERIEAVARQQGLSNEDAQAFVDKQQAEVFAIIEKRKEAWHKESSMDKEIGGEKFAENAELAKRAFDRVAPEGLKAEMDRTGYGNHPLVLKMFVNLGRMMANDKLVQGGAGGSTSKSAAELLYGSKT